MTASGFGTPGKLSGGQFSVENGRQPRKKFHRFLFACGNERPLFHVRDEALCVLRSMDEDRRRNIVLSPRLKSQQGAFRCMIRNHLFRTGKNRFRGFIAIWLVSCLLFMMLPAQADGTDLMSLQKRLLELGYGIGTADGIAGPRTASAILLAQTLLADAGFDVLPTGTADAKTAELIMSEENEELLRTLQRGSRGSRVMEAQTRLIDLNLLRDSADGVYGANTETAVMAFEEKMEELLPGRIQRDGRLSADEYNLLLGDLGAYGFEAPAFFDDDHPENLKETYLYAKNACLINAVTGETLLEKAADEKAEPASTTKIITLLTALSMCDLDETIVIPDAAAEVPADSSLVPVYPGETMTMRDLLYAMMIRSGNDAANAAAVLCAGSTEAFAEEMNRKAAELGMENSHFINPHGYAAEGHYTTARDLTTAARYGMTLTPFRQMVTCLKYTLPATDKRDVLPIMLKWEIFDPESPYYIPHAAGIKSGYTSSAGFCYVGAYQENGVTLIATVMGGRGRNMAWTDLKRLFAYGMAVSE